jgi:hypothetical protein
MEIEMKEPNETDDPFDIKDESMEIDDAVLAEGVTTEPVETPSDPDASNWQTELVRKARESGMSKAVIEKLESAGAVDDLLSLIASSVQKDPIVKDRQDPKASDDEWFKPGLDEESAFDPDAAKAIRQMNDFYKDKMRKLEEQVQRAISQGGPPRSIQSFVKDLGSEWSGVFGESESPNSDAMKRLEESVNTIRAGYTARHKRVPEDTELYKMALSAGFGDRQSEIERNKINKKVANRAAQIVSRPGTRTASSSNPRMRAAQGVADWFRNKGIDPYAGGDTFA